MRDIHYTRIQDDDVQEFILKMEQHLCEGWEIENEGQYHVWDHIDVRESHVTYWASLKKEGNHEFLQDHDLYIKPIREFSIEITIDKIEKGKPLTLERNEK